LETLPAAVLTTSSCTLKDAPPNLFEPHEDVSGARPHLRRRAGIDIDIELVNGLAGWRTTNKNAAASTGIVYGYGPIGGV
jgi:hypothetical protein